MKSKHRLRGVGALAVLLTLSATFVVLTNESLRQRAVAMPRYAQTYFNRWRPTVAAPTPPPVSALSRDELLATRPSDELVSNAPPSPFPTFTSIPPSVATVAPSPTPQPTATAMATPVLTTPVAPEVVLDGIVHAWQMWNNCGPTTIAMNLSYYGLNFHQREAASELKPNQDDKNVSAHELAAYAQSRGFDSFVGMGGSVELLQALLSNGFPVIVETWLEPEDRGGLGHYRLFSGYNSAAGYFIAQDSLKGPNVQVGVQTFEQFWRIFNRTFVVVYPPEREAQLKAILGPMVNEEAMFEEALRVAQEEAAADGEDPYAWFNLGTAYMRLGQAEEAASAFDEARRLGLPYRMLWYQFDIFEAYLQTGRYQEVIDLATATIESAGGLEEAYYYRALAQQALGNGTAAAKDLREALAYNSNFELAAEALVEMGETE